MFRLNLDVMNFYEFCNLIVQNKPDQLTSNSFPASLNIESNIWKSVKKLREFTDSYGYEHSTSIFWIDSEIFVSPPKKGSKESVYTRNEVSLKYVPFATKVGIFFRKEIYFNGKLVSRKSIKQKELPANPSVKEIFTLHSHPISLMNGSQTYSFFSLQDIESLLRSQGICSGLLTKSLFLVCKTKNSPSTINQDIANKLFEATNTFQGESRASTLPFDKLNLVLYNGQISNKLHRLN
ncbi:MAG: hypothetical protein PHS44_07175 [Candidatus Dojkabacteria bacterium]|nr:hypothetical protein [Candidatus Dojkabacteria bacterium]